MPTFQCTAACRHCGTFSSPRAAGSLPFPVLVDAVRQAAENGYRLVVFTGGEPTTRRDELVDCIALATRLGLATRVVTNAWWAASEVTADQMARQLAGAGLNEINFSTGDQHARFVPLAHIFRAIQASLRQRLRVCVMIETVAERSITAAALEEHPAYRDIRASFPDDPIKMVESPWMPVYPDEAQQYPAGLAANRENLVYRKGCDSCLATTTVQADGRIAACCGLGMRAIPELQLGNISNTSLRSADALASEDFLKRWIRAEGPERILAWAASHDPEIVWENQYAHRCQACLRIYKDEKVRRVIREHHGEKIADVLTTEWLLQDFQPGSEAAQAQSPPGADPSISPGSNR